MTAILTPEERKQKLKLYQKEMEDFTNFLKNKFLTNKNETENEIESDEETFKEYMESLQLRSEDLAKKILDVGSGSSQFGKWVNEHYKDSEVFSLDPRIESDKKIKT